MESYCFPYQFCSQSTLSTTMEQNPPKLKRSKKCRHSQEEKGTLTTSLEIRSPDLQMEAFVITLLPKSFTHLYSNEAPCCASLSSSLFSLLAYGSSCFLSELLRNQSTCPFTFSEQLLQEAEAAFCKKN